MMRVTLLGTGTSHGVPMISCSCAVCRSTDPRDKRTRPSIVVSYEHGPNVLVDTSPELRLQLVATGITRIDAVLFTHSHADHIHGIDDLRRFNEWLSGGVPVYAAPSVLADIRTRFPYIFAHGGQLGGGIPSLELHSIEGPFDLDGRRIVPIPVWHGTLPVLGFRFGAFAYVTDCSRIPPASLEALRGLDVLVLDALRRKPHPTHFSLAEAIVVAQELCPRRTYLTHLTHDISHREISAQLPPGIKLGYDGLEIYVDGEDYGRER
jgi:phosphoribosyl 1,2-cyclic phosphate phosphodiesterase